MQNLTTWEIRPDGEDSASPPDAGEESTDQDTVVTTASDASSGDRNVAANSVSSDEELVDITMKDPSAPSSPESSQTNKPKLPGQTAAPRWLDPSVPLTPYERCFNIAVWKDDKHLLPHGINAISLDREYPSIFDRVRKPEPEEIIEVEEPVTSAAEDADAVGSPVSEEDSDVAQLGESVTRMNDESSEDDDLAVKKVLLPILIFLPLFFFIHLCTARRNADAAYTDTSPPHPQIPQCRLYLCQSRPSHR